MHMEHAHGAMRRISCAKEEEEKSRGVKKPKVLCTCEFAMSFEDNYEASLPFGTVTGAFNSAMS